MVEKFNESGQPPPPDVVFGAANPKQVKGIEGQTPQTLI